jgi:hypothetical protein
MVDWIKKSKVMIKLNANGGLDSWQFSLIQMVDWINSASWDQQKKNGSNEEIWNTNVLVYL